MKEFEIALSGRVSWEGTVTVMDIEGRDEALRIAEIKLAESVGKSAHELAGIEVENVLYLDPGEEADYANNQQKTLRGL